MKLELNSQISKFINTYKCVSSRLIKKEFPETKTKLWRGYFWSQSFCLISTGGVTMEVIRNYIEKQRKR